MAALVISPETYKNPNENLAGFERTLADIRSLPETAEGAIDVAGMPGDAELTAGTYRDLQEYKAGDFITKSTVESTATPIKDIKDATLRASEGDPQAHRMVRANVRTDAMERIYKAGNIITADLETDAAGNIYQHGQRVDDIHKNAFNLASAHPAIRARTIAEANNAARIRSAYDQGHLKDHVFLVFSMCPEDISDKELDKLNFFSLTKSMSLQATTETEDGLRVESAFVAGVKDEHSPRHDRDMVEKTGERLGVDYGDMAVADIINRPIMVPKYLIPDGIVDIVRLMDGLNGGTFFGQDKPPQDYFEFKKFCARREAGFEQGVDKISRELIAGAYDYADAAEASMRLGKLVEAYMVKRAVKDYSIDTRVFGSTSAEHITEARRLVERGQEEEAVAHTVMAVLTASSGSCPAALDSTSMLSLANMQGYLLSGMVDAIISLDGWAAAGQNSWHGGLKQKGKCVNCKEKTTVGIKSWCRPCIKDRC